MFGKPRVFVRDMYPISKLPEVEGLPKSYRPVHVTVEARGTDKEVWHVVAKNNMRTSKDARHPEYRVFSGVNGKPMVEQKITSVDDATTALFKVTFVQKKGTKIDSGKGKSKFSDNYDVFQQLVLPDTASAKPTRHVIHEGGYFASPIVRHWNYDSSAFVNRNR